ncbi:UDP-glucuronosyltransferase 2A2-like [Symsagittifera roscoffensis]|uniref:UDP-glucuronosyltransferase 2A2-like n=1 Tax=Symsagittifera roscoffensis TaxID=84072 RepID=UPI00307BD433
MSTLLAPLCKSNNCTVFESAKMCEQKLASFHKTVNFEVIKGHGLPDEYSIDGNVDFLLRICDILTDMYIYAYNELSKVIDGNPGKFDLLIVDSSAVMGSLLVGEKYNMPTIHQSPGLPGGVECIQDKWPVTLFELYLLKPFGKKCWNFIQEKRTQLNLPDMDYQGGFIGTEYSDRFPMFLPTSPSIYPKPHHTTEHIYLGGLRDEQLHPKLSPELESWIKKNDKNIIYISLGTHSTLETEELRAFVDSLKSEAKYRFIWSLGLGLENKAKKNPKVKVYVSHCGLGSMVDQVSRAIPGVFVPQFSDQFSNAAKLESLETGIILKDFKYEHLMEAIDKVFGNYALYKKHLERLQKEFKQYENYEAINEFALKIASRKKLTVKYNLPYQVHCPRVATFWMALKVALPVVGFVTLCLAYKLFCLCCKKSKYSEKKAQ